MFKVIGWEADEYTELESFKRLSNAIAYAKQTVTEYGWMAAIVKDTRTKKIVFDTDTA